MKRTEIARLRSKLYNNLQEIMTQKTLLQHKIRKLALVQRELCRPDNWIFAHLLLNATGEEEIKTKRASRNERLAFKPKVAFATIKDYKTFAELAQNFDFHPNQIICEINAGRSYRHSLS